MVTSTLIGWGMTPRLAIGSANLAGFFVTSVIAATFVATIGLELWPTIAGLVSGGVIAAPLAAFMTRRLPERPLMLLVGIVIVLLSLRGLLSSLHCKDGNNQQSIDGLGIMTVSATSGRTESQSA